MKMQSKSETILRVGAEGGDISIERRIDAQGRWHYSTSTDESTLLDMLDDGQPPSDDAGDSIAAPHEGDPPSLDDALRSIGRYAWPRLHPIECHPEFEDAVLQAARFHPHADVEVLERFTRELARAATRHRETQRLSPHEAAVRIAAIAHRLQVRKGTQLPYISHVVAVAEVLAQTGASAPVVLAGLLHDVLEDFDDDRSTRDALIESFPSFHAGSSRAAMQDALTTLIDREVGQEARWLVEAVTEKKHAGDSTRSKRPWKVRKLEQLNHLRQADARVAALKAADALHNAESIVADSRVTDGAAFERFNASPDDLVWYYGTVAALCTRRRDGSDDLRARMRQASVSLEREVTRILGTRDPFTGMREHGSQRHQPTALVVQGRRGRIADVETWRRLAPPARPGHWRAGRSAMESARSWFAEDSVEPLVPTAIRTLLDSHSDTQGAIIRTVRPEHETTLDGLGKGRQHDAVAYGMVVDRRLVVTIEAKADEPFGDAIGKVLARVDRVNTVHIEHGGSASRVGQRVEQLSMRMFGRLPDAAIMRLRYQLLHALAGTVIEATEAGAAVACLVVQEFVGAATVRHRVERNSADYREFLQALGVDAGSREVDGTLFGPITLPLPQDQGVSLYIGKATTLTRSEATWP